MVSDYPQKIKGAIYQTPPTLSRTEDRDEVWCPELAATQRNWSFVIFLWIKGKGTRFESVRRMLCLKLLPMKARLHPWRVDQDRRKARDSGNDNSQMTNDKFFWERHHFCWTPNFGTATLGRLRLGRDAGRGRGFRAAAH